MALAALDIPRFRLLFSIVAARSALIDVRQVAASARIKSSNAIRSTAFFFNVCSVSARVEKSADFLSRFVPFRVAGHASLLSELITRFIQIVSFCL